MGFNKKVLLVYSRNEVDKRFESPCDIQFVVRTEKFHCFPFFFNIYQFSFEKNFLHNYLFLLSCKETLSRPYRRQITGLVLSVSFWPELEHKMAFVFARKDDVAVASF